MTLRELLDAAGAGELLDIGAVAAMDLGEMRGSGALHRPRLVSAFR